MYRHPLVLAYEFQELLQAGVLNNRAEIAQRCALSRARVTQVMSLLELPQDIQEYVLSSPLHQRRSVSGRRLREIVKLADEKAQIEALQELQQDPET